MKHISFPLQGSGYRHYLVIYFHFAPPSSSISHPFFSIPAGLISYFRSPPSPWLFYFLSLPPLHLFSLSLLIDVIASPCIHSSLSLLPIPSSISPRPPNTPPGAQVSVKINQALNYTMPHAVTGGITPPGLCLHYLPSLPDNHCTIIH